MPLKVNVKAEGIVVCDFCEDQREFSIEQMMWTHDQPLDYTKTTPTTIYGWVFITNGYIAQNKKVVVKCPKCIVKVSRQEEDEKIYQK